MKEATLTSGLASARRFSVLSLAASDASFGPSRELEACQLPQQQASLLPIGWLAQP